MDTQITPAPHKQTRKHSVSKAINTALSIRVREARTWDDCAEAAGLSPAGIYKARKRPEVQQRLEEIKAEYIQEVEALKAPHKARALEVARELLDGSTSDAVKARMVEFLAGESKGMSINVGVQVNNQPAAQGYEYAHPNQEIVTIRRPQDNPSVVHDVQGADIIEHSK